MSRGRGHDHHLHQIRPDFFKLFVHHRLHAISKAGDDDHRGHADNNAQHGEDCPGFAAHQGLNRQLKILFHSHQSVSPSPASEG